MDSTNNWAHVSAPGENFNSSGPAGPSSYLDSKTSPRASFGIVTTDISEECVCVCVCVCVWVSVCVHACVPSHFSHVRLCNPMDCSPPGSYVHGILQARMEWIAMPSTRGSSWPRNWKCLLCLLHWQAGFLPLATPGKSQGHFTPAQTEVLLNIIDPICSWK